MTTATFIKKCKNFNGDARLYRLSEPVRSCFDEDCNEGEKHYTQYVIISAVNVPIGGPETYIFPSNAEGEITHWGEMEGSFQGALNHERAIRNAGWWLEPTT